MSTTSNKTYKKTTLPPTSYLSKCRQNSKVHTFCTINNETNTHTHKHTAYEMCDSCFSFLVWTVFILIFRLCFHSLSLRCVLTSDCHKYAVEAEKKAKPNNLKSGKQKVHSSKPHTHTHPYIPSSGE